MKQGIKDLPIKAGCNGLAEPKQINPLAILLTLTTISLLKGRYSKYFSSKFVYLIMKKCFVLFLLFSLTINGYSQNPFEFGGEYIKMIGKGYNSSKAALRGESYSNQSSFSAGIIYHLPSKNSYSASSGFGFYAGYRYAFNNNTNGSPFAGARLLFSWESFDGKSTDNSIMITPMGEIGYHFIFGKRLFATPAAGFGYTIEFTKGNNSLDEDRGGRFIPSLSAGYRF
jgi:hypothetical protein